MPASLQTSAACLLLALVAGGSAHAGTPDASAPPEALAPQQTARPEPSALQVQTTRAPDGHGVAVEFVSTIDVPLEAVRAVLLDVKEFPAWLPRMKAVHTVMLVDAMTLRFETTMGLPWPVGDVRETLLARRLESSDQGPVQLEWVHLDGDMRKNDVRWTLRSLGPGLTEVRYQALMQFRTWLPVFAVRLAQEKYTPWFVSSLRQRALAWIPPPAPVLIPVAVDGGVPAPGPRAGDATMDVVDAQPR